MKKYSVKSLSLLLVVLVITLAACGSDEETTIVLSTWGFGVDDLEETIIIPFEEETGINVELDTGTTGERYSKISANPNYDVDVVLMSQLNTQKGVDEDLWESFDSTKLENYDELYTNAQTPNGKDAGPAYTYNRMAIVYNKDLVDGDVTSFEDVLYGDNIDSITIPGIGDTHGPSLMYAIGEINDIDIYTEAGSKEAFKELDKISSRVEKPYTSSTDVINMMESGTVQAALVPEYYFNSIKEVVPNATWVDPSEGAILNFNTIQISKNSEYKDEAYQLVDYFISQTSQQNTANIQLDPPVNQNVELDTYIEGIPFTPIDEFTTLDYSKVVPLSDLWTEEFNNIFAQ